MNNLLLENEVLDDLELDNLKIIQHKSGYKFSTDSVLLANFAKGKKTDKYIDLCSGSGVVAILFSWKNKIKNAYAVELQARLANMAERSIKINKMQDIISVINQDLATLLELFEHESVDVITVNPPYNKKSEEIAESEISIATHELKTNLEKIIEIASKLLKYGGKLFMVHRADRLAEIMYMLARYKLEPKVLRVVYPKTGKDPNLVLIEAKKGANIGLKILDPLYLTNQDGSETDELKQIYNRKS